MMFEFLLGTVYAVMGTVMVRGRAPAGTAGGSPNVTGRAASCRGVSLPERLDRVPTVAAPQVRQNPRCDRAPGATEPHVQQRRRI